MKLSWAYYTFDLRTNTLIDDDGCRLMSEDGITPLRFSSAAAAEDYLQDNDIRGTVR